jgi:hypothetical protein
MGISGRSADTSLLKVPQNSGTQIAPMDSVTETAGETAGETAETMAEGPTGIVTSGRACYTA